MKKISFLLAFILSLAIVLSGCGANGGMADSESYPGAPDYGYDSNGVVTDRYESESATVDIYNNENNKVIRTASLTIQTIDFDATLAALNELTTKLGGYFETAEVESGGYYNQYANRSAYYVVRIPKENFIAFRDGTGGIGHVYSIQENTQDVGETYYDTEARLATLTTKRDRLLALLEQATLMEDIITLENALADVQYEIDRHTATLRKYDSLIGYSTFNIRINEVTQITDEPAVTESYGARLWSNFKTGFVRFGEGLGNFVLWIARNLVGIIIFVVIVVVVIVFWRRYAKRKRTKKQENM